MLLKTPAKRDITCAATGDVMSSQDTSRHPWFNVYLHIKLGSSNLLHHVACHWVQYLQKYISHVSDATDCNNCFITKFLTRGRSWMDFVVVVLMGTWTVEEHSDIWNKAPISLLFNLKHNSK